MDEKERIRIAHFLQGRSIRQIAKELGHSRKTIRKAIGDSNPPVYVRTEPAPLPVIGPVKGIIDSWIQEDGSSPRKQRHTAHRIYERLLSEHGFTGAESTVRRYVRLAKGSKTETFVPLCFDPGEDAQADFGQATVIMDGKEIVVHLFCIQLSYSRMRFVCALPFEKQEALFQAHVQAFQFFGGVPRRIIYDNMTTATARALRGDKRREIETFIAFRSHYLFESRFCNPREPQEKGQIENLVGYVRRNWLVPIPRVKDFDELNAYLYRKCLSEGSRVISGMKQSIASMFEAEKPRLLSLPARSYDCFRLYPVRANKTQIVRFEGNSYSVPEEYASRGLFVKAYVHRVEISDARKVIARHPRLLGRGEESLSPSHYASALAQKPGAVENARPIKQSEFAGVYSRYLSRLKEDHPDAAARRAFIKVIELTKAHPESAVAEAMEMALLCGTCDFDAVKNLMGQFSRGTRTSNDALMPEGMASVHIDAPDISRFDSLLAGGVG